MLQSPLTGESPSADESEELSLPPQTGALARRQSGGNQRLQNQIATAERPRRHVLPINYQNMDSSPPRPIKKGGAKSFSPNPTTDATDEASQGNDDSETQTAVNTPSPDKN